MEICLGTDDDTWDGVEAAEVDNLVVYDLDHVERFPGGNRVDEDIAVDANGMFGVKDGVLVLCRVRRRRMRGGWSTW